MPLIPMPPVPEPREAISVRLDQALHDQLKQYTDFIHGSKDYVIGQALRHLFRKDKDFAVWVQAHAGSRTAEPLRPSPHGPTVPGHPTKPVSDRDATAARPRNVGGI